MKVKCFTCGRLCRSSEIVETGYEESGDVVAGTYLECKRCVKKAQQAKEERLSKPQGLEPWQLEDSPDEIPF